MSQYRVGRDVDAWCSRCGFMLLHTIEAMVGDTIKRVHCNTCHTQHMYRAHKPGEGPSTPRASAGSAAAEDRPRRSSGAGMARPSDFDRYMEGRSLDNARPYSPKSRFAQGDVVAHPSFGTGVVTGLKDGGKVELLFREGPKVLIHGR